MKTQTSAILLMAGILPFHQTFSDPAEYRWRLTSLFQLDRVPEVKADIESLEGVEVIGIDFDTAIATVRLDAAELYRNAKNEDQIREEFSRRLRTQTRGTVEALPLSDTPAGNTKEVRIPIAGLDCKGCSFGAYLAVNKIEGVDYCTASFHTGEIFARIDTRTGTTEETLREALLKKEVVLNYQLPVNPARIPGREIKVLRVSSEEPRQDQEASKAFDGDPQTLWHTKYAIDELPPRPHEIVLDLGKTRNIKGFEYLARQTGENGVFAGTSFFLSDDPKAFPSSPAAKTTFEGTKVAQSVDCPKTASGRYLLVQIHSTVGNNPHSSAAEIGIMEAK